MNSTEEEQGWAVSSFCESSGCVEFKTISSSTIPWEKSSFCESNGCVEVAPDAAIRGRPISAPEFSQDPATGDWLVRSSMDRDTVLRYTDDEWQVFLRGVRNGELNRRRS